MSKTMNDLSTRVLLRMNEGDLTGTPSAEDDLLVKSTYQSLLLELENDGLATWAANEIPDLYFLRVVDIVSAYLAPDYGVSPDPSSAPEPAEVREQRARNALRKLVARPYTGAVLEGTYF